MIDKEATFGERIADRVAGFGGSWTFIIAFGLALTVYRTLDSTLGKKAWDPYPFILGSVKPRSSGRGYKRLGSHVIGESFAAQCKLSRY
jgi:Protein of unknown function (DUF1003)